MRLIKKILNIKSIYKRIVDYLDSKQKNKGITNFNFNDIHLNDAKVVKDRETLLELLPKNGVVCELGVNKGRFSEKILKLNKPKKLHLVDIWDSERYNSKLQKIVENKFSKEIDKHKIEINKGYSIEILKSFNDNYFDWVYIDTTHNYQDTIEELNLSKLKVKSNGIISGHDYITRSRSLGIKYGVVEAVNEFCVKNNWKLIYITLECNGHSSFAIKKI